MPTRYEEWFGDASGMGLEKLKDEEHALSSLRKHWIRSMTADGLKVNFVKECHKVSPQGLIAFALFIGEDNRIYGAVFNPDTLKLTNMAGRSN